MAKVGYHDHTIELISTQDAVTVKWSPKAVVHFIGTGQISHPVSVEDVFDTRQSADERALQKAKDWIDRGHR
jgi:hypothetical protein